VIIQRGGYTPAGRAAEVHLEGRAYLIQLVPTAHSSSAPSVCDDQIAPENPFRPVRETASSSPFVGDNNERSHYSQ
jgi:hypothetical protein